MTIFYLLEKSVPPFHHWKQWLYKILRGKTRCIMGYVKVVITRGRDVKRAEELSYVTAKLVPSSPKSCEGLRE